MHHEESVSPSETDGVECTHSKCTCVSRWGGCRVVIIDARTDCRERRHGFIESRTELLALNIHAPQYCSTLGKVRCDHTQYDTHDKIGRSAPECSIDESDNTNVAQRRKNDKDGRKGEMRARVMLTCAIMSSASFLDLLADCAAATSSRMVRCTAASPCNCMHTKNRNSRRTNLDCEQMRPPCVYVRLAIAS